MKKKMAKVILALMLALMLSSCAGLSNYTDSTDRDDGFYHGGKGKYDGTHRY